MLYCVSYGDISGDEISSVKPTADGGDLARMESLEGNLWIKNSCPLWIGWGVLSNVSPMPTALPTVDPIAPPVATPSVTMADIDGAERASRWPR